MKANELRIGNLVINPQDKKVWSVIALIPPGIGELNKLRFGAFFLRNDGGEQIESSDVESIPLNEEWLLKFGFKEFDVPIHRMWRLRISRNGEINVSKHAHGFELELSTKNGYNFCHPQVDYVHQLQNLYFALTGQELKMNKNE